eukprot:CAMPEP_0172410782 /NCGR_PEP_ID=MMETSP1061-20121228/77059_1 /TAXON_ID=37318 /ORGANISM="Pseudo-nitzschia pungens, Strain cf. pungens" /LENGTH=664 /DNA_ID=CAMNT_0013146977 /DNA_START=73 /DNA_END=2067 /DNA_ORIENTATION=+
MRSMRSMRSMRDDSSGRSSCEAALWFLLLLAMCSSALSDIYYETIGIKKRRYDPPDECGLYLAPSSIPGAGLGMYSGSKKYEQFELVSDSDLMIPTWDLDYHNGNDAYYHLWDEYTWSTSMFPGMYDDVEAVSASSTISSGFGAAINCMMPLVNVADEAWDEYSAYKLTTSGVASDSPGAGAFTPMTGRRFEATKAIEPFSELYASYGEGYFDGRAVYDFVPFERHYDEADKLIQFFIGNVTSWRKEGEAQNPFVESTDFEQELWGFIVQLRTVWDKAKVLFALPGDNTTTIDDLKNLMDFGGSKFQTYNDTKKDIEWMNEHAQCMDNIREGVSKIPHAGRGAFASRFIPKDGLVSPAPLIHLPNRSSLTIYDHKITDAGKWIRKVDSPSHHQLLLNYCFGHRDTSMVLCPYGYLNFLINHDHKNPNTKVVWTEKRRMRHPEWFDMPVKEWGGEFHSGLSLDYVALRDIQPGEEITIDYGIDWETAWQEHVENFDRPRRYYTPAFELNEMIDLRIPTTFEPLEEQFEGVVTFCREYYFPPNYDIFGYRFDTEEDKEYWGEYHYTCRVLIRHDDNRYTVEVFERERWIETFEMYERRYDKPVYILFDVPRDAIFFRDRVYHRDHHQPWSFRHDMRLPDEIFPEIWKTPKNDSSKATMTKSRKGAK